MEQQHPQTPDIRLMPPLVYALALLVGLGIEQLLPLVYIPLSWRSSTATFLIVWSFFLVAPSVMRFRKAATPFDVSKSATTLITDGPYRYTRNPGYLALTLLYLGLAVLFGSAWACIVVVPTALLLDRAVIRKEEQHLEIQFGETYLRYKERVRRWL